jgi:uncharacterized membrane protein YphA (DoxX/SURF4 family)
MLNPFPTMWLSLLAYFLLRFFIGITLVVLGYKHLNNQKALADSFKDFVNFIPGTMAALFAFGELALAGFIIAGYGTQYACIAGILMCLKLLIIRGRIHTPLLPPKLFYFLLLGAFASLFITGAGAFAYDLPL